MHGFPKLFFENSYFWEEKKSYYKEVEQDFAPVIQRCVTFPRMIQLYHESSLA